MNIDIKNLRITKRNSVKPKDRNYTPKNITLIDGEFRVSVFNSGKQCFLNNLV